MSNEYKIIRIPETKWVKGPSDIEDYLPGNYTLLCEDITGAFFVFGQDDAGWTAEGYVIPRLASAMIFAELVNYGAK